MTREIKFRVWDDSNRVMVTNENCNDVASSLEYKHDVYHEDEWYPAREIDTVFGHLESLLEYPDITLLQFTGLKDKNGTEIYESDIVQADEHVKEVVFDDGCFCVYISECTVPCLWDFNKLEVIGNIHENPELLEA